MICVDLLFINLLSTLQFDSERTITSGLSQTSFCDVSVAWIINMIALTVSKWWQRINKLIMLLTF